MHNRYESRREIRSAVAVFGAGAAGIATALSASRAGAEVCLIEQRPQIGGTVTHSLIHTLAGLYDNDGELLNAGLVLDLMTRLQAADAKVRKRRIGRAWVLNVRPQTYANVVNNWLAETEGIQLLCSAQLGRVDIAGQDVASLDVASQGISWRLFPSEVVDATGSAELVRRLDSNLVEESCESSAGGLIFTMRGVSPAALHFPGSLRVARELRSALQCGDVPPECLHTWIDTGIEDDEVYVKLMIPLRSGWRQNSDDVLSQAHRNERLVLDALRSIPEFQHSSVEHVGTLGVRDGGRIRGEYRLSAADVRAGSRFTDAVCRCAWPIEYWHSDRGVELECLRAAYEIPLRCLKVARFQNVWAAGKCLSADREAHASARVVGSCWAMGDALGKVLATKACVTS